MTERECMCVCVCVCVHACMFAPTNAHTHTHTHAHIHKHTHTHARAHTHASARAHTHTRTHTRRAHKRRLHFFMYVSTSIQKRPTQSYQRNPHRLIKETSFTHIPKKSQKLKQGELAAEISLLKGRVKTLSLQVEQVNILNCQLATQFTIQKHCSAAF